MKPLTERLASLAAEIRRRRVGRVAVAYAVTAWLLVSVADTVFPRLLLPEWTITALIVAALLGFPIAVALAWTFDVVPDPSAAAAIARTRRWAAGIVVVAVLAIGASFSSKFFPHVIATTSRIESLVVLPFENLSGAEDEYFVSGMYDELIGELAQIGSIRVISRRSAMRYRDASKPLADIAQELDVDGVIDGAVMRTANGVQIRVALIRPLPREQQLWSQSFTRDVREVRALHGDIARAIAKEIRTELTADEANRLSSARGVDPAAYEAYLRGMFALQAETREGIAEGLKHLHRTVELNPADAAGWAALSYGYATIGHGLSPGADTWPRAREAALRAAALDPSMAEAHAALADVKLYYEWDWEGAEREFRRANELNPSLAMNRYHYAWFLALFGRMEEAIREHIIAKELDPFTPLHTAWLGGLYNMVGRYDDAIREARLALELRADAPAAHIVLADAHMLKGEHTEALRYYERLAEIAPPTRWMLASAYIRTGQRERGRAIAAELEKQPTGFTALGLAQIYSLLGDYDRAFAWLEFRPNHAWLPWVRVIPWITDEGRNDPRYGELLQRMRLPQPSAKPVAYSKSAS